VSSSRYMRAKKKGLSKADEAIVERDEDDVLHEALVHIGRRIRELRQMQGLTLAQLGEFTGIPTPEVSRIEAGKYNLTIRTATRIARGLGVYLHELFVPRDQSGIRPRRQRKKKTEQP
jgi:transcriptional regulator with XRE-family HTH domain